MRAPVPKPKPKIKAKPEALKGVGLGGKEIPILKNPGRADMERLGGGELKYVLDDNGDRYVFPGWAYHDEAAKALADQGAPFRKFDWGGEHSEARGFVEPEQARTNRIEPTAFKSGTSGKRGMTPGVKATEVFAENDRIAEAYGEWIKKYPPTDVRAGTQGSEGSLANFARSLGVTKNKAQGVLTRRGLLGGGSKAQGKWSLGPEQKTAAPSVDEVSEGAARLGMSPEKYAALSAKRKALYGLPVLGAAAYGAMNGDSEAEAAPRPRIAGPRTAYHGSDAPWIIKGDKPDLNLGEGFGLHVGSKEQAKARLDVPGLVTTMEGVRFGQRPALGVQGEWLDKVTLGKGREIDAPDLDRWEPQSWEGALLNGDVKGLTPEERDAVLAKLQETYQYGDQFDASKAREALRGVGVQRVRYRNEYEQPGQYSYAAIDPDIIRPHDWKKRAGDLVTTGASVGGAAALLSPQDAEGQTIPAGDGAARERLLSELRSGQLGSGSAGEGAVAPTKPRLDAGHVRSSKPSMFTHGLKEDALKGLPSYEDATLNAAPTRSESLNAVVDPILEEGLVRATKPGALILGDGKTAERAGQFANAARNWFDDRVKGKDAGKVLTDAFDLGVDVTPLTNMVTDYTDRWKYAPQVAEGAGPQMPGLVSEANAQAMPNQNAPQEIPQKNALGPGEWIGPDGRTYKRKGEPVAYLEGGVPVYPMDGYSQKWDAVREYSTTLDDGTPVRVKEFQPPNGPLQMRVEARDEMGFYHPVNAPDAKPWSAPLDDARSQELEGLARTAGPLTAATLFGGPLGGFVGKKYGGRAVDAVNKQLDPLVGLNLGKVPAGRERVMQGVGAATGGALFGAGGAASMGERDPGTLGQMGLFGGLGGLGMSYGTSAVSKDLAPANAIANMVDDAKRWGKDAMPERPGPYIPPPDGPRDIGPSAPTERDRLNDWLDRRGGDILRGERKPAAKRWNPVTETWEDVRGVELLGAGPKPQPADRPKPSKPEKPAYTAASPEVQRLSANGKDNLAGIREAAHNLGLEVPPKAKYGEILELMRSAMRGNPAKKKLFERLYPDDDIRPLALLGVGVGGGGLAYGASQQGGEHGPP